MKANLKVGVFFGTHKHKNIEYQQIIVCVAQNKQYVLTKELHVPFCIVPMSVQAIQFFSIQILNLLCYI